jgi:hypothetical protein
MEFFPPFFFSLPLKPTINFMLSFFPSFIAESERKIPGKTAIHGRLTQHKTANEKKWDARRIMEFIISSTHSQTLQRKYFSPLSCNARCYNISPFLS